MVNVVQSQNDALMNLDKHGLNMHTIVQTWGTWDKSPYSSLYYTWSLWLDYIQDSQVGVSQLTACESCHFGD
jgi:hypothetical protein